MDTSKSSKFSSPFVVFLSIFVQLVSIPILYGLFELITSLFSDEALSVEFYLLRFPVVNYTIIFSTIVVTSIRETTQSELLTSVMHTVWILFVWSETKESFLNFPIDYIIFMLCITLTIPIRLIFQSRFSNSEAIQ